jgi:hypothetical protein
VDVRFVSPDLRHLDEVRAEAMALPLFEGERPLRGAIGLVDWRLCGALARAVHAERFHGRSGERLLLSGRPKLPFEKIFVYGVGPRDSFDEQAFSEAVAGLFEALCRARVRTSLCLLPGREAALTPPTEAMELFLGALGEGAEHDEVTLIEEPEAQKEMTPVVERAKRRARAERLD